jgi:hypothetical protein
MKLTEEQYEKLMAGRRIKPVEAIKNKVSSNTAIGKQTTSKGTKQTKTELEYGRKLAFEFPDAKIIPWGLTLRMSNGHKYTPDLAVLLPDKILLVEVKARGKNGFRQPSFARAKLAYDQCRVEYPYFEYRFAEKYKGVWNI